MSGPATGRSSIWGSRTCSAICTRTSGSSPGGTTAAAASTAALGLRIDLLLGTAAVASRVRHVEIDREYRKKQDGHTVSDHAPVLADLD